MKNILFQKPPENIKLKVFHKPSDREGWETTGVYRNNIWRLKQNEDKTVDFKHPTHWDYLADEKVKKDVESLTRDIMKCFPEFFDDFTNFEYGNGIDAGKDFKKILNKAKRLNKSTSKN